MNSTTFVVSAASLFLSACNAAIIPLEGAWTAALSADDNGCGIEFDEPLAFNFADVTEDRVTYEMSDDQAFDCELFEGRFDCVSISITMDFSADDIDAALTRTQSVSGTLEDQASGRVDWMLEITCDGERCDTVSENAGITLPCITSASGPITHGMN